MRHARFAIGERERDAWVTHMTAAVQASGAGAGDAAVMVAYFRDAAAMLVNAPG